MIIQAHDIALSLGGNAILHGVSLEASGSRLVGILGPNGSGKSTFLKTIYRTLKPDSGAILIDGTSIESMSYKQSAQRVAVLAQHNFYSFDFQVLDVVLMGRAPYKKTLEPDTLSDREMAYRCLDLVGMSEFAKRSFRTLSGGEQQRVILARALIQDTPCLILDEPTNHLDIKYQLQLMDLVSSLDRTIVAAIHDLTIAAMYCDEIYLLKSGCVFTSGIPREVLTEAIIAEVYGVDARVITDDDGYLRIQYRPRRPVL